MEAQEQRIKKKPAANLLAINEPLHAESKHKHQQNVTPKKVKPKDAK